MNCPSCESGQLLNTYRRTEEERGVFLTCRRCGFTSDRPDESTSSPAALARGGVRPIPMTIGRGRVGGPRAGLTVTGEGLLVPSSVNQSSDLPGHSRGVKAMMSRPQIEALYRDARYLAENATGSLAERAAIEAALLKRIINGGRA